MKVSIKNKLSRSSSEADLINQLKRIKDVLEHGIDEDNFLLTATVSKTQVANDYNLCPLAVAQDNGAVTAVSGVMFRLAAPEGSVLNTGYAPTVSSVVTSGVAGGDLDIAYGQNPPSPQTRNLIVNATVAEQFDEYHNITSVDDTEIETTTFAAAKRVLDLIATFGGGENFTTIVVVVWAKFRSRNENPTV